MIVDTAMFKKFTVEESISSCSQIKNSVQRQIQSKIVEQFPLLEEAIDLILPKKAMMVAKAQDNVQLIVVNDEIMFYSQRDGPFFPSLKLLHKFPTMMTRMQVDKGAIRFILSGANIMAPGFTSAGGKLPLENIDVGYPVAIFAEGKQHPLAVGITLMSSEQIKSTNKGIAVETVHYIADGLWQNGRL